MRGNDSILKWDMVMVCLAKLRYRILEDLCDPHCTLYTTLRDGLYSTGCLYIHITARSLEPRIPKHSYLSLGRLFADLPFSISLSEFLLEIRNVAALFFHNASIVANFWATKSCLPQSQASGN